MISIAFKEIIRIIILVLSWYFTYKLISNEEINSQDAENHKFKISLLKFTIYGNFVLSFLEYLYYIAVNYQLLG